MNCSKCGNQCSDDAKFCTVCGNRLEPEQAAPPVQPAPQETAVPPVQPMPQAAAVPPVQPAPQETAAPPVQPMPQTTAVPPVQPMPQTTAVPPVPPMQPMPYVPAGQPAKKGNTAAKIVICVLAILLVVCVGVLAAILVNKGMQKQRLNKMLEQSYDSLYSGDYEEAVAGYLDVLEADPENEEAIDGLTDAYLDWADSYVEAGDYDAAIALLEGADSQAKQRKIEKELDSIRESMQVNKREIWTDEDFFFTKDSETLEVAEGNSFLLWDDISYLTTDFADNYYEEHSGGFATDRGLKLGMTFSDYKSLYNVESGYAIWELLSGENREYTSFYSYNDQDPYDMYEDAGSVWLDIGYAKVNGSWEAMTDVEVRDVWFCEADLDDYGEVVILSVNVSPWDEVIGIGLYHIDYNEEWKEWQDWVD